MNSKNIEQSSLERQVYNLFIISWLFIPILLLFVFSFFTISENLGKTILYSLNFFSIVSYFNGIRNNPVDIPIILTLISSFVLYCYIFDKIQEGTEIQKDKDDIYQKFFPGINLVFNA